MKTFNLQLSKSVMKRLELIKQKTENRDLAEVLRRSLALYDLLNDEVIAGGKIFIHKPDGSKRELRIDQF